MANTFTQIYVQFVFSVKGRLNLIQEIHRERIEKYLCGIISGNQSKPIALFCNPDHVHILIGLHPSISISEMAKQLKANSSKWINNEKIIVGKFNWQEGFGAFSYSKSQIDSVVKYIINQREHHKRKSFREEYLEFLRKFEINYDESYLFEYYD